MMGKLAAATGLALLLAGAAAPETALNTATLTLAPGETATVTIDDGGAAHASGAIPAAALSDFEAAVGRNFNVGVYAKDTGQNSAAGYESPDLPKPAASAPGIARLTFVRLAEGRESLLVVANGYDQALAYRAAITVHGQTQPTEVCLVVPAKHGFEHWPYAIDRIQLSQFRLQPWHDGEDVPCA